LSVTAAVKGVDEMTTRTDAHEAGTRKKRGGRPSRYSPEMRKAICEVLRVGVTRACAARHAGVSDDTLRAWMERHAEFAEAVEKAEADCEARMTARLYQEATREGGDWRAALAWLKCRRPAEWGDKVEVAGADGGPIEIVVREYPAGN
jgi:Transposase